jgi:hypothetical protein
MMLWYRGVFPCLRSCIKLTPIDLLGAEMTPRSRDVPYVIYYIPMERYTLKHNGISHINNEFGMTGAHPCTCSRYGEIGRGRRNGRSLTKMFLASGL